MIIELWHYNFKLRYNKIDSQHKKDLNPAEIDEILNNAIIIWCEEQYSGNNSKKESFEQTQQRNDNLSSLTVKYPVQPLVVPNNNSDGIYEFPLSTSHNFIFPYLHLVRVQSKVQGCSDKIYTSIEKHDDLDYVLSDPFKYPSKGPFPRAVASFGKSSISGVESSLFVYTLGKFTLQGIYPEYIKRPAEVSIGGYPPITGGANKTKVECDLPRDFHTQIIDIAVSEAERIINNIEGFKLSAQKQTVNS